MLTDKLEIHGGAQIIDVDDNGVFIFTDANGTNSTTAFLNGGFDPTTVYTKTAADALLLTKQNVSGMTSYRTSALEDNLNATKLNLSGGTMSGALQATTLSASTLFIGSVNFNELGIYTPFVPSGSSESYGVAGEYAVDSGALYICHTTNTWIKITGTTF